MKVFKSLVGAAIVEFLILAVGYSVLIFLIFSVLLGFNLYQLLNQNWGIILIIYTTACYIYTGLSSNDIILYDDKIEIVSNIPLFKKHLSFPLSEIQSVQFRHEWAETSIKFTKSIFWDYTISFLLSHFLFFLLPTKYKWIKVTTDQTYKFYCFGIEMDNYDNADSGLLFEDLFFALAHKGIIVSWTDNSDHYYQQMNKQAKEILASFD